MDTDLSNERFDVLRIAVSIENLPAFAVLSNLVFVHVLLLSWPTSCLPEVNVFMCPSSTKRPHNECVSVSLWVEERYCV